MLNEERDLSYLWDMRKYALEILFNLDNTNLPIPQFVHSMNEAGISVTAQ
jgi:hypothetical protein